MTNSTPQLYLRRRLNGTYQLYLILPIPRDYQMEGIRVESPESGEDTPFSKVLILSVSSAEGQANRNPVEFCLPLDRRKDTPNSQIQLSIVDEEDNEELFQFQTSLGELEEIKEKRTRKSRMGRPSRTKSRAIREPRTRNKVSYIDDDFR